MAYVIILNGLVILPLLTSPFSHTACLIPFFGFKQLLLPNLGIVEVDVFRKTFGFFLKLFTELESSSMNEITGLTSSEP